MVVAWLWQGISPEFIIVEVTKEHMPENIGVRAPSRNIAVVDELVVASG